MTRSSREIVAKSLSGRDGGSARCVPTITPLSFSSLTLRPAQEARKVALG